MVTINGAYCTGFNPYKLIHTLYCVVKTLLCKECRKLTTLIASLSLLIKITMMRMSQQLEDQMIQ